MSDNISFKKHSFDISVNEVNYVKYIKDESINANWLTLNFAGSDFNVKMANTIRRVAANRVPTYAIPIELINIESNTTVAFNNDYMRLQLSTVPIADIDPNLYQLDEKHWYKVNFTDPERDRHKNEQPNEYYVDVTNNTTSIIPVTTTDLAVHVAGEKTSPYSEKYPILLIKLRPKDHFKCHFKSVLGVGDLNAIWKAARNGYYDEIETSKGKEYVLTLEGNWQFSEYELYIRSCKYLIFRLNQIKVDLTEKMNTGEIELEPIIQFSIPNEDHTIGELLNYEFQSHDDILGSGCVKPDHLIRLIMLNVESVPEIKHPINAMLECIDICIKKFQHIGKLIENLAEENDGSHKIQTNKKVEEKESKPKKVKK